MGERERREGKVEDEEEERLCKMVDDFLESEADHISSPSSESCNVEDEKSLILKRIIASSTKAEKDVYESLMRHLKYCGGEGRYGQKKGLVLRMRMEGYDASLCRSSWSCSTGCPGGDYEYIDIVELNEAQRSERLIVDIDFRSQFEIARPTAAYTQLYNSLPSVFVGTEQKLNKVISLACSAAKKSLTESGLHIPPWRKACYLQSKWLSSCQRLSTAAIPIFSREKVDRTPPKISSWVPPKLIPRKRQMGFQEAGLSKEFSSLRCPPVA
ncbi:unnamed protein product [Victoria cruziana]